MTHIEKSLLAVVKRRKELKTKHLKALLSVITSELEERGE